MAAVYLNVFISLDWNQRNYWRDSRGRQNLSTNPLMKRRTYRKVSGDISSGQNPSGCWEEDGKDRKKCLVVPKVRTEVLDEDRSCKWESSMLLTLTQATKILGRKSCGLTFVAKKSFGLFTFCWHECPDEIVSDSSKQDDQKDNLSLTNRRIEGS